MFLYAAVAIFVCLRRMLYEFRPQDLSPPYWVAMGACAITALADARIVEMVDAPMVTATRGLIGGLSVVFWALATWLIPSLVAAGWWRHRTHRMSLEYEAALWSIVFPLEMYAVAGFYLGQANQLPLVGAIGRVELWVAFAAGSSCWPPCSGTSCEPCSSPPGRVDRHPRHVSAVRTILKSFSATRRTVP